MAEVAEVAEAEVAEAALARPRPDPRKHNVGIAAAAWMVVAAWPRPTLATYAATVHIAVAAAGTVVAA